VVVRQDVTLRPNDDARTERRLALSRHVRHLLGLAEEAPEQRIVGERELPRRATAPLRTNRHHRG
jgi:hypothetical protein